MLDDLPDQVVTTIRNDYLAYQALRNATSDVDKAAVLGRALKLIGDEWLRINEVAYHPAPCQQLGKWMQSRELTTLLDLCRLAVEREFERLKREA